MSLMAVEYRTLEQEFEQINTEFVWDMEDTNKWYFCVRASDEFLQTNGRYPNPGDEAAITGLIQGYLTKYNVDQEQFKVEQKYIEEM